MIHSDDNLSLKGLSVLEKFFVFWICLLKYLYSKYKFYQWKLDDRSYIIAVGKMQKDFYSN